MWGDWVGGTKGKTWFVPASTPLKDSLLAAAIAVEGEPAAGTERDGFCTTAALLQLFPDVPATAVPVPAAAVVTREAVVATALLGWERHRPAPDPVPHRPHNVAGHGRLVRDEDPSGDFVALPDGMRQPPVNDPDRPFRQRHIYFGFWKKGEKAWLLIPIEEWGW